MTNDRIGIDPEVQHGRPVIEGTRVPVHILVGSVAGGMPIEDVARGYGVEVEDVQAGLGYASRVISRRAIGGLPIRAS